MNRRRDRATEVKAKLDRGDNFVLIDVREPHEYQICSIPCGEADSRSAKVAQRLGELDPERRYRAPLQEWRAKRRVRGILDEAGFQQVRNMKGGILAWSDKVDPTVPKY